MRARVGKTITIIVLCLIGLVILGAIVLSNARGQQSGLSIGSVAPNFTLSTVDGQTVSLSNYKGTVVALSFWGSFCDTCRKQMEALQSQYKTDENKGFVLLSVDVREPTVTVNGYKSMFGLTMPILLDSDGTVSDLYKVDQIPETYFIDPSGVIRSVYQGPLDGDLLRQHAEATLPGS